MAPRLLLLGCLVIMLPALAYAAPKKDVLMIAVDDMRTEIGAYGCPHMQTPALDALAARGVHGFHGADTHWSPVGQEAFLAELVVWIEGQGLLADAD